MKNALRDARITRNEHDKIDPKVADRQWEQNTNPAQQRDTKKLRKKDSGKMIIPEKVKN